MGCLMLFDSVVGCFNVLNVLNVLNESQCLMFCLRTCRVYLVVDCTTGGCWNGESIFDILDLADSMTFVNISFGKVDNTASITGDEYYQVENEIKDLPMTCAGKDSTMEGKLNPATHLARQYKCA